MHTEKYILKNIIIANVCVPSCGCYTNSVFLFQGKFNFSLYLDIEEAGTYGVLYFESRPPNPTLRNGWKSISFIKIPLPNIVLRAKHNRRETDVMTSLKHRISLVPHGGLELNLRTNRLPAGLVF